MNDDHYDFSLLPEIDSVDVLVLDDTMLERASTGINSVHAYILGAVDAPCIRVKGAQALQIATLCRRLLPGEEFRCHIPPFGLRFYSGTTLVLQASVCWQCNNVYGYQGSQKIRVAFDATSSDAQELLSLLKQVTRELSSSAE